MLFLCVNNGLYASLNDPLYPLQERYQHCSSRSDIKRSHLHSDVFCKAQSLFPADEDVQEAMGFRLHAKCELVQ